MMWSVSSSACLPNFLISLLKYLFKSLAWFLNWVVSFLFLFLGGLGLFVFLLSFIYSRYTSSMIYVICKHFLPVCGLSFYFLSSVFLRAEIDQNKYWWNLFYLFFPFVGLSLFFNLCFAQVLKSFFLYYLLLETIVLGFAFRSVLWV